MHILRPILLKNIFIFLLMKSTIEFNNFILIFLIYLSGMNILLIEILIFLFFLMEIFIFLFDLLIIKYFIFYMSVIYIRIFFKILF